MDATDRAPVLDVVARARGGDEEAFRSLVEEHSRRAFQLAFRMTGNEQDAEDVVQESFLRAYRELGRFEARANFGTWLHRIVANCAVDAIRARQARGHRMRTDATEEQLHQLPTSDATPERLSESEQIFRCVVSALDDLTPLERAAFTLRHYEGRSIAEISKTLNLNTSAAKHSVFRAVKKLRIALSPLRA